MGLLDKWLKKEKTEPHHTAKGDSIEEITEDMVRKVMDKVQSGHTREVICIDVSDTKPALSGSKFGGTPYVESVEQIPVDAQGRQLTLLAQINAAELPDNTLFPDKGLLQFWALNDDITGMDEHSELTKNDRSRVTYREFDRENITAEEVTAFYKPYQEEEDYFPICGELSLEFTSDREAMSSEDYQFTTLFLEEWHRQFPEYRLSAFYDLPDEAAEIIYDDASGSGHKMGGYPCFTQYDPREDNEEFQDYQVLLLQIDSIGTDDCEIMWGDAGVGNFFITKADLERLDFSHVLYTWDCG